MKPIETIWFENISVFSEPVLSLGPIRASMKQLLYTLLALALAFSLLNFVKQPLLAVPTAGLLLLFAYAKPYGMNFEVLLIDMVSFFKRKKATGTVAEDRVKDKKVKDKDKVKGKTAVTTSIPVTTSNIKDDIASGIDTGIGTSVDASTSTDTGIDTGTDTGTGLAVASNIVSSRNNLLHYIVPKHKDFNLEVTDNELVVVTGDSTIHIPSSSSKVKLLLEIDNREIVRIVVDEN